MPKDATQGPTGGPPRMLGYPIRAFDEAGNEIIPEDVGFTLTGGRIDYGDQPVPHNGRLVQGVFKGRVKGGKFTQVDSRWQLVTVIAVEAASVREIPLEEIEGTMAAAVAEVEAEGGDATITPMRAGRRRRKPKEDAE